jgi:putative tricarboxylic transport membrane protein
LLVGAAYACAAFSHPIGTLVSPGPGLFPLLAGLTMTLAGLVAMIAESRAPSLATVELGTSFRRVPMLVAALVGYAIVLKPVGFLVASTALAGLVLVILGRRRVWTVSTIAVALSAGTWLTFRLLGVPLPRGPLPF